MKDSIFASLDINDKYLLAIYTLFCLDGSETRKVKTVMSELTGKPFVDFKNAVGILRGKGLLNTNGYNWRTDTYDYAISDEYIIPSMIYFSQKEKELTIDVLNAAKSLEPSSVQKLLWKYIGSGFNDVSLEGIDDYHISIQLESFIPALYDSRFAPLLILFSEENFFELLESGFIDIFKKEKLVDVAYLRLLINSYKASDNVSRKTAYLCLCDLYDFMAYGGMPQNLLAGNKNHNIIAGISEAYKGKALSAFEYFKKALALHNKNKSGYNYTKRINYFLFEIVNCFYVTTAYVCGTEEGRKAALCVYKASNSDITLSAKVLYEILYGGVTDNQIKFSLTNLLACNIRISRTLATLMCHYVGKELANEQPPQWLILCHEMRKYRHMDSGMEAKADAAYGKEGLLASIYHKQEWENVLEELMGNTAQGRPKETSNSRIAYFINRMEDRYATAKMQTILKNGMWSAGKSVGMANFYDCAINEMNADDNSIAIAARREYTSYNMIPLKYILPKMAENSRLYIGIHAPYTLVEVTEELPYISLLRTPAGFVINSNVPSDSIDSNIIIVHTGASSINYIHLSEQQQPYYRRLLALGHFPLEAEQQLREFLKGIGGKIEVNSDLIEGGSTLPIVDGQSLLIMQMRPSDKDSYAVNVFVRPLEGGRMRCKPGCGDEIVIDCNEDGKNTRVKRNLTKEQEYLQLFADNTGVDAKTIGETAVMDAYDLLPIVEYAQQNTDQIVCEWQDGAHIKIRNRGTASWGGAIKKTENGWFEIEGAVEIDQGEVMTMAKLLDLLSQSRGRFIKLGNGDFLSLSDKLRKQLTQINAIASRSHGKLQMSPFSAALLGADILEGELSLTEDDELKLVRKRIKEASTYSPKVPATLNATLRKYQKDGYRWMSRLSKWGAGALLADDMGLGKTIQTITYLLAKADDGPALVVAPASVAPNWKTEFEKFAPSLNITILNFAENRQATVKDAQSGDVVITTYGLLLSVKDFLVKKRWTTICLDEAHIIKNRGAKTSAVAMQLKSDNRIMLTGTPVQNHLGELWNLFQFVNPGLLGSFEDFSRRFIVPIELNGDKTQQKELDRLVKPFMLRRTKDKVAKELPEKEEIYQHVTLSDEELLIYEVLRRKAEAMLIADGAEKVTMNTLAEITRLRQCSCDVRLVEEGRKGGNDITGSKITALVELLQTIIESFTVSASGTMQGGALVFSQFTSYLALIKEALTAAGIPYLYIDGSIEIKTRQKLVEEFQNGSCPVFLISLKAGGLGLNLTRANYVIHMDPWWNPAIEAQATDRVHRIGQKQSVTVYHLIAEGTIEEKIQRLHERKQALVQDILESTDMSHKLTGEDLLEMVKNS